jgi:hypothetical protein
MPRSDADLVAPDRLRQPHADLSGVAAHHFPPRERVRFVEQGFLPSDAMYFGRPVLQGHPAGGTGPCRIRVEADGLMPFRTSRSDGQSFPRFTQAQLCGQAVNVARAHFKSRRLTVILDRALSNEESWQ